MKVLLITQNPICTYSNIGKTLDSLFQSFSKEELCQLYTYPSLPDINRCNSYYQISDLDVLQSVFRRKKGREILETQIKSSNSCFEDNASKDFYKIGNNKTPLKIILRDLMWDILGWKTKYLYEWIDKEKPTHIFVLPGRFTFIHKIALKIADDFNLPIITYICDDFLFVNRPNSVMGRYSLSRLRKQTDRLLSNSKLLVTVCDELTKEYVKYFDIDAITIMTGSNYPIERGPRDTKDSFILRFFGNISLKRYVSLYEIGVELDNINNSENTNIKLEIYSSENIPEANELFALTKSIEYKGFVQGEEFKKLFFNSPIVVHVESFDLKYVDIVKHSVSTKIADSLSSGNLLFAYGPSCVSSITHLMNKKYGAVVTDKTVLNKALRLVIFNRCYRDECICKGLEIAMEYHNSQKSSCMFYKTLEGIMI